MTSKNSLGSVAGYVCPELLKNRDIYL